MAKNKNYFILIILLVLIVVVVNFVFSQQSNKFTLLRTENRGFKFITNQDNKSEFVLTSDSDSAYLRFGATNTNNAYFAIRPSFYSGSYIYSVIPNQYGGQRYVSIGLRPQATSVIFTFNDTAREGMLKYAKIYANLKDAIAIYNCSYGSWLVERPQYTCLGKIGYYSQQGGVPPGANYTGSGYQYRNPSTCFGNNKGRVLQEICTGDCWNNSDDSALTICVLHQPQ